MFFAYYFSPYHDTFKVTRAIIVSNARAFEFHFPPAIQFSRPRSERYFKVEKKKRILSADTHHCISHMARKKKKKPY